MAKVVQRLKITPNTNNGHHHHSQIEVHVPHAQRVFNIIVIRVSSTQYNKLNKGVYTLTWSIFCCFLLDSHQIIDEDHANVEDYKLIFIRPKSIVLRVHNDSQALDHHKPLEVLNYFHHHQEIKDGWVQFRFSCCFSSSCLLILRWAPKYYQIFSQTS